MKPDRRKGQPIYLVYMHHFEGVPFYIGYGNASRPAAADLERERVWRDYVASLPHYDIRVLLRTTSKAEAIELESRLIDLHWPTLTNGRRGHTGNYIESLFSREKQAA